MERKGFKEFKARRESLVTQEHRVFKGLRE